MMTAFGGGESAWGESDAGPVETAEGLQEAEPNAIQFGDGHYIEFTEEGKSLLLHHPAVVAALEARAAAIAAMANSLMAMDPRAVKRINKQEGLPADSPAYDTATQNLPGTTRARARAKTANMLGVVDEAHHSTLYKAMMADPSDPVS